MLVFRESIAVSASASPQRRSAGVSAPPKEQEGRGLEVFDILALSKRGSYRHYNRHLLAGGLFMVLQGHTRHSSSCGVRLLRAPEFGCCRWPCRRPHPRNAASPDIPWDFMCCRTEISLPQWTIHAVSLQGLLALTRILGCNAA